MEKTLGGDRLRSGNKMKIRLHNYERSTHDLGNVWRSTMAPGVLIPFYKKVALNGDTWTIDTNALVRTMPAIGPLFGAYKIQMDYFVTPIRLYNGLLHNNAVKIGMDMAKVKLPKINIQTVYEDPNFQTVDDYANSQVSPSSLMAYLGIRGYGSVTSATLNYETINRTFNAVPFLCYYDIFKQYYSNKQEEYAYVMTNESTNINQNANIEYVKVIWGNNYIDNVPYEETQQLDDTQAASVGYRYQKILNQNAPMVARANLPYAAGTDATFEIKFNGNVENTPYLVIEDVTNGAVSIFQITDTTVVTAYEWNGNTLTIKVHAPASILGNWVRIWAIGYTPVKNYQYTPKIEKFLLTNIDDMKVAILRATALNTTYTINSLNKLPYSTLHETNTDGVNKCKGAMNGLVLKTYQSDIFNNWLSKEWIDGINGINNITAIDTSQGSFTIDSLNLANKVYNMLNRIAVSGGTYQDWQEAVWGEDVKRMIESPMYVGGMSGIITFEEVVSTADTETAAAGDQPLGSLAGKGVLTNVKGGHVEIHIGEPSYIMGIVSITPLLDYSQGNDFDMIEFDSLNDLHKPALDQIGFENLMLEQCAWWGKQYDAGNQVWVNNAVGKLPAWINYMTSYNKVYGDFAIPNKLGWMVLNRNYEEGQGLLNGTAQVIPVKDFTTYINPSKYNYQFANIQLDAQNFWVQIGINAIARRKMSAKIIPNL